MNSKSEDLNSLLDVALSLGCDALEKEDFLSFAITLQHDGSVQRSGELTDEEKSMDPEKLIEQITATLAAGADKNFTKESLLGWMLKLRDLNLKVLLKLLKLL